MPATRVLLVGSGITNSLTSFLLKKKFRDDIYLEIWDKAKGVGGRMSTSRSPACNSCKADLGAQYITVSQDQFQTHKELYDSLLSNSVISPLVAKVDGMKEFPPATRHFIAPNGMNSVVHHFVKCDSIKFEHQVSAISPEGKLVRVETTRGVRELFDAVILTMPVPQVLQLSGGLKKVISSNPALYESLNCVKYSSRYALGLYYDACCDFNVSWDVKYLENDSIFRYVALDSKKRNCGTDPDACVFHTTVQFGNENIESPIEEIREKLLGHVHSMFPDWPKPVSVKCQKWRYSQVVVPYVNRPGCAVLIADPLVVAGGDGFMESNFNGCVSSAVKLADVFHTNMIKKCA